MQNSVESNVLDYLDYPDPVSKKSLICNSFQFVRYSVAYRMYSIEN